MRSRGGNQTPSHAGRHEKIEHEQSHGDGEDTIAPRGQAFDALSGTRL
jgi:hypothetical protein